MIITKYIDIKNIIEKDNKYSCITSENEFDIIKINNSLRTFKFIIKDIYGYYYETSFPRFKDGTMPAIFHKSNPYTIQNIKLWCKLNDKPYELLSEEYQGNKKLLKWKCLKSSCGEIFKQSWDNIFRNHGCPYCAGQKVGLSNCLATKNPDLAQEWHPTKNGDLTPYDVTCGSNKDVWWQCKLNHQHEWRVSINSRNSGNKCPYCSGLLPTKEYNLLTVNPELCEEWNYNKNKSKPEEYCPNSGKSVWWKCKDCGHEWEAIIANRNDKNEGCPKCKKSKGEKRIQKTLDLNEINYIPQKEFPNLLGVYGCHLSYDFYLPDYNLLIEYQGEFHESQQKHVSKNKFKRQQEHDRRKREYAKLNDYKLLEIWYWDFDRIEEILIKELNL